MIKTAAEARQQKYTVPKNLEDHTVVHNFDGYAVATDLGFNLHEWGAKQLDAFKAKNSWDLDELEIRLMYFYIRRMLYFSGYTYHEYDHELDTLLQKLAELKGTAYEPLHRPHST